MHRDLPPTTLYAFGLNEETATVPGPTIIAKRGVPLEIFWQNNLLDAIYPIPVDTKRDFAMPVEGGIPLGGDHYDLAFIIVPMHLV